MRLPSDDDLAWVRGFRRSLARRTEDLCDAARRELGRDPFESLTSDVVPLLAACRWVERHGRRVLRPRRVRGGSVWQLGQRHRVVRAPLGRVGIIATWNYPVHLMGVQMVHALGAGNRVVVKPSERTPETQGMVLDMARTAGMPEERLSWTNATREAGAGLIEAGGLDHVVFTGSTGVGRTIARTLADSLTPSTLELSGCDSAIVLGDADPGLAARSIAYAVSLNAGRTCMCPRRVIVSAGAREGFLDALIQALGERAGPDAKAPEGSAEGGPDARVTDAGGVRLVTGCDPGSALARGEHFDAVLAVINARDDEHAFELDRLFAQRLATSVFTRDVAGARRLAPTLDSGVVTINDCIIPVGHPGVSLGGRGPSGWGVTQGEGGLLAMTRPVFVSTTPARARTPTDPPSDRVRRGVTRFVRSWYGR